MPTIKLTDSEFWWLIQHLDLNYDGKTGVYKEIPEYDNDAQESLCDKLCHHAGYNKLSTPTSRRVNAIWEALKDASKG